MEEEDDDADEVDAPSSSSFSCSSRRRSTSGARPVSSTLETEGVAAVASGAAEVSGGGAAGSMAAVGREEEEGESECSSRGSDNDFPSVGASSHSQSPHRNSALAPPPSLRRVSTCRPPPAVEPKLVWLESASAATRSDPVPRERRGPHVPGPLFAARAPGTPPSPRPTHFPPAAEASSAAAPPPFALSEGSAAAARLRTLVRGLLTVGIKSRPLTEKAYKKQDREERDIK